MSDVFDRLYRSPTKASIAQRTTKFQSPESHNIAEWHRPQARQMSIAKFENLEPVNPPRQRPAPIPKLRVPSEPLCVEIFNRIDVNGNGILSLAELDKAVVETWPRFNNKPAIMRAYKAADRDNDGFVRKDEFRFFLRFISYYNNLWITFSFGDHDGDRRLTRAEFVKVAPQLKIREPEKFFDEMDTNKGGYVLFDEFCAKMASQPEINYSSFASPEKRAPPGNKPAKRATPTSTKPAKKAVSTPRKTPQPKKRTKEVSKPAAKPKETLKTPKKEIPEAAMKIELPPPDKIDAIFKSVDINGNGYLSLAELDKAVVQCWPKLNNKKAIMRAYKAADFDSNGYVGNAEFPFFLRFIRYYNNMWSLFTATDKDGDRRLSKEEFVQVAPQLKIQNPKTFFDEMDANAGGVVLFDEFCAKMAREPDLPESLPRTPLKRSIEKDPKLETTAPPSIPKAAKDIIVPSADKCLEIFDSIDMNGNRILSLAELDKAVVEIWPDLDNKPAIMRAYKAADADGNGFIKRDEFAYFLRFITYYNNLWHVFAFTDEDGDRRLTKEEFVKVAPKLKIDNPEQMFEEMDKNKGGVVLFDEFCARMAKESHVPDTTELEGSNEDNLKEKSPAKEAMVEPLPLSLSKVEMPPTEECKTAFDAIDINGNGILSLAEIDKAIVEIWPKFNNKPAIMRAYKTSDRDGNGFIKRDEFPFLVRLIRYYNNLWKKFEIIDVDGDCRLSRSEFADAAHELNVADPDALFDEMDTNKGGYVLFDEFCYKMATQSVPSSPNSSKENETLNI